MSTASEPAADAAGAQKSEASSPAAAPSSAGKTAGQKSGAKKQKSRKKRWGLLLDQPGAPATPHTVPGFPGYFRPDVPTPVGGPGELELAAAREASGDDGIPLQLVEIKSSDVAEAEELAERTLVEGRRGIAAARGDKPTGAETARVKDEAAASKGAS